MAKELLIFHLCPMPSECKNLYQKERVNSKSIFPIALSQLMIPIKVRLAQQQAASGVTPSRDSEGTT